MYKQVETKRMGKKGWLLRVLLPVVVAMMRGSMPLWQRASAWRPCR